MTEQIAELMLPAELSAGGLPLLSMGRDIPDGRMFLRDGRLRPRLDARGSADYFERVRTMSRDMAARRSAAASPTTRSGSCTG